jgi:hypothetical protein
VEQISAHAGIVADTEALADIEFRYPPGRSGPRRMPRRRARVLDVPALSDD